MEEFSLECPICLEELIVDNFHQITYGIVGQEPIRSIIVEEGCKDCLLAEDIRVRYGSKGSLFNYEIINQEKYIKTRKINWVKKVLQGDPKDFVNVSNATKIMEEKGVFNFTVGQKQEEKIRWAKKFLATRKRQGIFEGCLTIPTSLLSSHFTYVVRKSDLSKIIDIKLKGNVMKSSTHRLPIEKLKELEEQNYVFLEEEKDGSITSNFFINKEDKKTACRKCGEIKSFDKFRYQNKQMTFSCFECESKKQKNRFSSLSPEEYKKVLEGVKAWRKANRDKVREYKKTPQARAFRNVRKRLSKFLKTAKDHHFSKGVGCTRKELVKHLESQFTEGMSWETYGAGENGDHIGSWHIDHIKPISKFKGEYPNHYTNLQPMWGMENIRKGNKL